MINAFSNFSYLQYYAVYLFSISLLIIVFCLFLRRRYGLPNNFYMVLCYITCGIFFKITFPSFPRRPKFTSYRLAMKSELFSMNCHLIFIVFSILAYIAFLAYIENNIYANKHKHYRMLCYLSCLVLFLVLIRLYYIFFQYF